MQAIEQISGKKDALFEAALHISRLIPWQNIPMLIIEDAHLSFLPASCDFEGSAPGHVGRATA